MLDEMVRSGASLSTGDSQGHSLVSKLSYVLPGATVPVSYAFEPPPGEPWESAEFVDLPTAISDARRCGSAPRLHKEGFELTRSVSAVRNFDDAEEVKKVYYDEVLSLALCSTGGSYGFVFDHLVRKRVPGQQTLSFGRRTKGAAPSANGRIHNDYTERSGKRRLALVLGDEDVAASIERYCIVNVWRPIRHPVYDAPLALCDSRTVSASDAVTCEVRYPRRSGEIYLFKHSPRHRWYFYSEMSPEDAVVFKQYDSQLSGVSRFTPHSAFDLPDALPDKPMRQSIEARVLVVFD